MAKDVDVAASKNEVFRRIHMWEQPENSLAPLTPKQRNVCLDLSEKVTSRPIPKELSLNVSQESEEKAIGHEDELVLNGAKMQTAEELMLWCISMEDELLKDSDVAYSSNLEKLKEQQGVCSDLLDKIGTSLGHLKSLKSEYDAVSSCTNALHDACQQLLTQQTKLSETAEAIGEQLRRFKTVDSITQQLDAPTLSIYSESFISMLDHLDQTLIYLKEHPNYKDSNTYLVRVEHCLNKATELIRLRVTTVLSTTTEQVKNVQDTATHFTRFQAVAIRLKPVMYQLEKRRHISHLYESVLDACIHSLVTERESLLNLSVKEAMRELSQQSMGDYCALMRSACTLLIHISADEHRLYSQFFSEPSQIFTDYMQRLCMNLYDTMRPFVIHMKYLETLAELCSILRSEMLQEHVQNQPYALEAFGNVVEQLLRDIQERLVFRAHLYFKTDIEQYHPSPGDLAYPDKLELMESIAQEISAHETASLSRAESHSSLVSVGSLTSQEVARINGGKSYIRPPSTGSPADLHGMWYPPVRRTLVCLSRLYRCVEKSIFQGLSQEAINACIKNVSEASKMITANKTPIDGELFQIKHLLILREQLAPFQVDFTVKEMSLDFSKMKSAALGLLERKAKLLSLDSSNALFAFLLEGTPLVRESNLDARKEVDKQLKASCESFISHATDQLVGPLLLLLDSAQKYLKDPGPGMEKALSKQPFAAPNIISQTVQNVLRNTKAQLPSLQRSMSLYLANPDTQFILYRPIKNNVIGTFSKLSQLLLNNDYSEDDRLLIGCPSAEQVSVLLSSAALTHRKISTASDSGARRIEDWHRGRKISFENGNVSNLDVSRTERLSEQDESQLDKESTVTSTETENNLVNSSSKSNPDSQTKVNLVDEKSKEES
nr:PREDICTED: conserved oligomeric Golgi complex subunit 3 [Bemisia tabaci]